ncbi:condensation domain-containing protein, partial [Pedobacter cryoconitis]|uniref:condensation domain-containing protein n=1 Tax=Pedobacter cryoconitis TaxID=188932 RepID=UPI0021A6122D
ILPLTPNGKVDKRSLPSPEGLSISSGPAYVAPRTKIEERLIVLWQQLLGRDNIGIKDNFFEIGGHSLKATRLIGQIHKIFEVKITVKELFATPVLERQARLIQQAGKAAFMAISPLLLQSDYILSSSQRRLWLLNQFEEGRAAYHMPAVYVFEGNLDFAALALAFNSLLKRHEILRTVFKENEWGEVRQVVLTEKESQLHINRRDLRTGYEHQEKVRLLIQQELLKPFDLEAGPLVRAGLYQLENHKWLFTYVMHHIISDGWSMGILIKELIQLYNAYTREEIPVLASLGIQYKDYAAWQQEQLTGENLKPHRDYWLQQFTGELPVMQLPGDQVRPLIKTYNGNVITKTFTKELVSSIKKLTLEHGTTLFMGLLAGVNTLLYRYTGQEDQIIGSPIAGRDHIDLEDQIGFYVNTLALRSRFKGTGSFKELLTEVKQITLDAYEHQVYPFDELVEVLQLQRDSSRSVLFDVMMSLQTNDTIALNGQQLGKLVISSYEAAENQTSKFDLIFSFVEVEDEIRFGLRYNSDIFAESTALRFTEHLIRVFEAVVAHP